jgi:hypothetical protein
LDKGSEFVPEVLDEKQQIKDKGVVDNNNREPTDPAVPNQITVQKKVAATTSGTKDASFNLKIQKHLIV